MTILFISTMPSCSWGGSEELWLSTALQAISDGHKVIASVPYDITIHKKLKQLKSSGSILELIKPKRERNFFKKIFNKTRTLFISIKQICIKLILWNEYKYYEIGKFRNSGEIHQWMYDKFSLSRLLKKGGFHSIKVCSANESRIDNWSTYHLDVNMDGTIYKPDSIYIEAIK